MNFDDVIYELDLINNCLKIKLSKEPIDTIKHINNTLYVGLNKTDDIVYIEIHYIRELIVSKVIKMTKGLI